MTCHIYTVFSLDCGLTGQASLLGIGNEKNWLPLLPWCVLCNPQWLDQIPFEQYCHMCLLFSEVCGFCLGSRKTIVFHGMADFQFLRGIMSTFFPMGNWMLEIWKEKELYKNLSLWGKTLTKSGHTCIGNLPQGLKCSQHF